MLKIILISVLISVVLSSAITIFAMRIMSEFITRFLTQTEDRFDQKLGIYKQLKEHDISK
jgi:Na+-transporting methylmalonyl-CoA/oxaloacetate decarboxylase gamma subunit